MEVVLYNTRLSYVHVWEPAADLQGNLKYGVSVLMPDSDKTLVASCKKAIDDVLNAAVAAGKLAAKMKAAVAQPLRDGSMEYETGQKDLNYKGFTFFNARSNTKPSIVDANVDPIMDPGEVYSGCWANVAVSFYFTNSGGTPRVAAGLNHIQKVGDDDRLDGRSNVEEVFKKLGNAPGDEEGEDTLFE